MNTATETVKTITLDEFIANEETAVRLHQLRVRIACEARDGKTPAGVRDALILVLESLTQTKITL